jgi:hypothetical protein
LCRALVMQRSTFLYASCMNTCLCPCDTIRSCSLLWQQVASLCVCPWQAAERAVAESNREIGGYPVAAINIPTDRLTHYGLRQVIADCTQQCEAHIR